MIWTPKSLPREGPLYVELADRIADDVAAGRLEPGARLPAQRELAARLGVDPTTVTRAYGEARRRGLVVGHVGRGTFVRNPDAAERGARSPGAGAVPVDLSLNLPPRPGSDPAVPALARTLSSLLGGGELRALLDYEPNAGSEAHRAAGAEWIARRGLEASPERVVVCGGAQHGLAVLLLTLAAPGDVVLAEALTYPGFRAVASQLHLTVEGLPADGEGVLADAFEAACRRERPKRPVVLYCTPTLHNPTAATMSAARRQELARVAARHGVAIVEDDVYGALVPQAPPPVSSFAPEQSYFVTSLSKSVAPGLRAGFVLAPSARAAERVASAVRSTVWTAPPMTVAVAAAWVRDGTALRLLDAHRAEARARQALARRALGGLDWRAHPDGYHGWLELPAGWSSAEFVAASRRAGVVVTPGDAFAVGDPGRPAVRLALGGAATREALGDALARLRRLLDAGPESSTPVI